eukprot:c7230_g1_i1.p1 GENE.c7230_g1_i1~~c7230_g1_i1.p1  ORF type:complete len:421 (+),score=169.71 c7230_g1_i1:47-1264(+)
MQNGSEPKWTNKAKFERASQTVTNYYRFSKFLQENLTPESIIFCFGNPFEAPLPELVQAFRKGIEPQRDDWYGYIESDKTAVETIATSLQKEYGLSKQFEKNDIWMTSGALVGLSVTFEALIEVGDEVIFTTPKWFFYESQIIHAGGVPVEVPLNENDFDLDLNKVKKAITSKTRVVVVNSPHNPSGRIFSQKTLVELSQILTEASKRNNRPIYIVSDEAYKKVIFPNEKFVSPVTCYPYTVVLYTFAKQLLCPGQRLGYIALSPLVPQPEKDEFRARLNLLMTFTWTYPNGPLQYIVPDIIDLNIDNKALEDKKNLMVKELRLMGYEIPFDPQGTFYILVKSPLVDDYDFITALAKYKVFVLPGTNTGLKGYFRISLTPSIEKIRVALPFFSKVLVDLKSKSKL